MRRMASTAAHANEADESLMLHFAAGDMTAFDTLYARHEMGVWRYVLRSVREQALADTLAADSGFGPVRQLESRQQAAALIDAVEQLPEEQREAFLLQAEGGLRVEEIASTTGVSFETAKSRLRYARNHLRQRLKEFA